MKTERTKDLTDEQLETQVFEERDARETARIEKESDEAIQAVTATRQQKRAAKRAAAKKAAPKKARVKKTKEQKKQEIAQRVKAKTAQLDEAVDQKAREEGSQLGFFTAKFKEAPSVTFVNEDGDSETISLDVNTTEADDAKILELMQENIPAQQSKKKGTETTERAEARAAQTYFNKQENPNDAVEVIAHEVSFADGQFRAASDMSDGERAYFAGTGKDRAKMALRWIRKNLSPETNKQVDKMLELHRQSLADSLRKEDTNIDHVETSRKLQKKADLEAAISAKERLEDRKATFKDDVSFAEMDDLDFLPDYLREDAVVGLDVPPHPVIGSLLRQGKLGEALRALSTTSPSPRVAQLAKALSKVVGDTKVEVKDIVVDEAGNPVAGKFDPKTNTITLNATTGINPHTLLHEMTHAATSQTLSNKSHPLTKQLQKLFNDVKDSLGSVYGAQNVDEFVAEAFSNPEFQRTLAGIHPNGEPISALTRFMNSVSNVLRRIMGMKTKPLNSALNNTDRLIQAMLSPAPDSRFAGELYMLNSIKNVINAGASRAASGKSKEDKVTFIERIFDFMARVPENTARGINMVLPLQAVVDLAGKYRMGVAAAKLQATIEKQIGAANKADERVDATLKAMERWLKANPKLKEAFDRVVYRSTIEGVDPSKPRSTYDGMKAELAAWDAMQADWRSLGRGWPCGIRRDARRIQKDI